MKRTAFALAFLLVLSVILTGGEAIARKQVEKTPIPKGPAVKKTALFEYDTEKKEIIKMAEVYKDFLRLKFVAVTVDQPTYWPNEDVFLKIVMPLEPSAKIRITLRKKDAAPRELGEFKLNDGGVLVEKIMSGEKEKLQVGEYTAVVAIDDNEDRNVKKTGGTDGKIEESVTFSVVEGSLGAVSFAHEFTQLTNAAALEEVKGGWFLGNAEGAGKRWGNGLCVRNEVRVMNQPFTGDATILSRCHLPGCNGCEAGPSQKIKIENGSLAATLDVGGHSGPFELEVVTDKGSVKNLFGRSGHVERQTTPVTANLYNAFNATLAPYEGTRAIAGREIYIESATPKNDASPIEIESVVAGASGKIDFKVRKDIVNATAYAVYPEGDNKFATGEVKIGKKLSKGDAFNAVCHSPFTFIAIAGFTADKNEYFESWAIAFTESPITVEIKAPEAGAPSKPVTVGIKCTGRFDNAGKSVCGILEVFDNRVASKNPKEGLVSSTGDSFRALSDGISSWRDMTGYALQCEAAADEACSKSVMKESAADLDAAPAMPSASAPPGGAAMFSRAPMPMAQATTGAFGGMAGDGIPGYKAPESAEPLEAIREGEKKVVFCAVVKTAADGTANTDITLPPQTGRCKIRFVALNGFDYAEKIADIDNSKKSYVEAAVPSLLTPGSKLRITANAFSSAGGKLKLKVSGACLDGEKTLDAESGRAVTFDITGRGFGKTLLELSDASGKIADRREYNIKNISAMPVTFSKIKISDGTAISIEKGRRVAIYANPGKLLSGIVKNIVTTMYSWFGHAEAISSAAAIRAILLRAIDEKLIGDDGMRDTLKTDLLKSIKDLNETFYNKETGMIRPYPGMPENPTWTIWVARSLNAVVTNLSGSDKLKAEFAGAISTSAEMLEKMVTELSRKNLSIQEFGMFDPKDKSDMLPVEVDGKVVYKSLTDDAVIEFFKSKIMPGLMLDRPGEYVITHNGLVGQYDKYRFLRAFERTGSLYYLLLNAKALLAKNDRAFFPLFNRVATGLINTADPGLIQGPAMLGGVYSAPQTALKFIELLVLMAKDKKISASAMVGVRHGKNGKTESEQISDSPYTLETKDEDVVIEAPEYAAIRIDETRDLNLYDHLEKTPFFTVKSGSGNLKIAGESAITLNLGADRDPSEYYAIIAAPSVLSIKQTDDILSDYRGNILYGQKTSGGEKIHLVTVPFRGSREMTIHTEGAYAGESEGFITVRHISNPDDIVTVKTDKIKVE